MKIAIVGAAGRMGRKLSELAPGMGFEVVARVDVVDGYDREWPDETEGVVDFSHHSCVPALVAKAAERGLPYVVGAGLTADEQSAVDAAARRIPVVQSGNYSLGVNLLVEFVQKAAAALEPDYDIEVAEMHHRHKKDAPSGTALMLAKAAAAGRGVSDDFVFGRHGDVGERPVGEIAIHALRGGSVVGDHVVMFAGDLERIELTHRAQDRAAFAAGALMALAWAKGRSAGAYTMRHVLGFA